MTIIANNSSLKSQLACTILYNYDYFKNITHHLTNIKKYNYICKDICYIIGFCTRYG